MNLVLSILKKLIMKVKLNNSKIKKKVIIKNTLDLSAAPIVESVSRCFLLGILRLRFESGYPFFIEEINN